MTTEQLDCINSINRGIATIERLLANPGHLRLVQSTDRDVYYNANGYYSINKNVSNSISLILENAQQAIKCILGQELVRLKSEFEAIRVQNLDDFGNVNKANLSLTPPTTINSTSYDNRRESESVCRESLL